MKLRELHLTAVGPFTDTRLSFAPTGLHLIYGPNEAGKSSALRALTSLFYGFPARTSDDFRHSYGRLRVGGVLEDRDGRLLSVTRRKGRIQTLRDGEDSEIIPESALTALLGDVDQERFQAFFGIDHPRLVEGGQDIIRGGGRLGELLFSAGAGMARFHEVRDALQQEMAEIYGPRSRKPRLNAALKHYGDLRREVRESSLSRNEWEERLHAHEELKRQRDELAERLRDRERRHSRLRRLVDALPLLAEQDLLSAELTDLQGVPDLPDDFTDRRRDAEEKERAAHDKEEMAEREGRRVAASLEALPPSGPFPARAEEIRRLFKSSDTVAAMEAELPDRRAALDRLVQDNARRAADLFPDHTDRSAEALSDLFPDHQRREEIRDLAAAAADLEKRISEQEAEVRRADRDLSNRKSELDRLPPSRDTEELSAALSAVRRLEDTPRRLDELSREETDLLTEARRLASAIPADPDALSFHIGRQEGALSVPELEEISRCRPPVPEAADAGERAAQEAEIRLSAAAEAEKTVQTDLMAVNQDLLELDLTGPVPTEADVQEARQARDELWRQISADWMGEIADGGRPGQNAPVDRDMRPEDRKQLGEEFSAAVRAADETADRLRREAERVSRRASLAARKQTLEMQMEQVREDRDAAKHDLDHARQAWNDLWQAGGLMPGSPAEMRSIPASLARLHDLLQRLNQARKRRGKLAEEWNAALISLDRSMKDSQESAAAAPSDPVPISKDRPDEPRSEANPSVYTLSDQERMVRQAAALLDRQVRDAEIRERLTGDIQRLSRSLSESSHERDRLRKGQEKWREHWAAAVAPVGIRPHLSPDRVVQLLAEMQRLSEQMASSEEQASGIRRLEDRVRQFDAQARALFAELTGAPADAHTSAHRLAEELHNELGRAGEMEVRRADLMNRMEQQRDLMEQAGAERSAAARRIEDLCREAGVENAARLPGIESQSRRAKELRKEMDGLERQLAALAADADLSAFRKEAQDLDGPAAESEIRELTLVLSKMKEDLSELDREIGRSAGQLDQMDGRSDAARKAQQARSILADIRREADRYACLQLASSVLEEAVESYRKTHQGPVITRGSELFRQITAGAFSGIGVSVGQGGEPVVTGIRSNASRSDADGADRDHSKADRPDRNGAGMNRSGVNRGEGQGEAVDAAAMSDGTADQLYLAIRLASLELYLDAGTPMPFIADDILIQFDDERSLATLQTLADLGQRTQIIFFTHHRHLIELSQDGVPEENLTIHHLDHRKYQTGKG